MYVFATQNVSSREILKNISATNASEQNLVDATVLFKMDDDIYCPE